MRKTFLLQVEGKHPDRVLDRVKHEVRKYFKRERARALPEGADYWDFDCKFGLSQDVAQDVHLAHLITCIDSAAKEHATQVYVEILAKPGVRTKRLVPMVSAEPHARDDAAPHD